MRTVALEIEDSVWSQKIKAAESLAAARLESSLVFQLDDEPIPGVDTPSGSTPSFIALAPQSNKQKRDTVNQTGPLPNAVLINTGINEATEALADVYRTRMQNFKPAEVNRLEEKIDLVESSLGKVKGSLGNMKSTLGDMQKMIWGVLQVLSKMNAEAGLSPPTV